jgi:pilus assembly protein Flp/PilA
MRSGFVDLCLLHNSEHGAIRRIIRDSRGVTAIEYALIAALIAVAAIAAFTLVGTNLSTTFSYVASQL